MSSEDENSLLYVRATQGLNCWVTSLFQTIGTNSYFTRDVLSIVLQFSSQDSLLEEERAEM